MIDGKSLLYALREELNEDSSSSWLDTRSSYTFLYQAAVAFVKITRCMKNEQEITTVADQSGYTLNADFMRMYLKNTDNELYLKYNDGTSDHFITFKDYEDIVYENQTSSKSVPDRFTIIDDATIDTRLSSTVTSDGDASGGECTLTDTAADFSDVSAGDMVHNTTDGSDGIVLSKTSSTALVTALFEGTDNEWDTNDAYVIQPQARLKIVLSPPSSTSSHTVTVYYIQRPAPVYSDYGIYRIPAEHLESLTEFAAFKYKRRDAEPDFAREFLRYWDLKVRGSAYELNNTFNRKGFSVTWKKKRT